MKHYGARLNINVEGRMRRVTPLRAIRFKCLDCSNQQPKEVRLCPIEDCPLYSYRFGRMPKKPIVNINEKQCFFDFYNP